MIQTYQGYFQEDGSFIANGILVKPPTRRRAIINVLDDEITGSVETAQMESDLQQRIDEIKDILAGALAAEDNALTDEDWDEMADLRTSTNFGLSSVVEL